MNTTKFDATLNELEEDVSYWEEVDMKGCTPATSKAYADAVRALVAYKDGKTAIAYIA